MRPLPLKLPRNGLLPQVCLAHLVSHLHMMTVPALLPLLSAQMRVGFVELGMAIGVFGIVTALVQAPFGFLVDRLGARRMLMAALLLGSASFALLAAFPGYSCLLAAMALAGVANGVYHPADYSLLSRGIAPEVMGRAFSIHTFAGYFGAALAPVILVHVALAASARWAFAASALAGGLAWCVLRLHPPPPCAAAAGPEQNRPAAASTRPRTAPIASLAVLTLFFALLSLSTGGIEKFSVSALLQGFDVPLPVGNTALSAFLFASAFGVLAGGVLADRTEKHGQKHGVVAAVAFGLAALMLVLVILVQLSPLLLALALGASGFLSGVVAPSRDMLVRAASPPGAEGRTFGIVSTGFNIGGITGPLLFGFLLDQGRPAAVLWAAVGFMVATMAVVFLQEWQQRRVRVPVSRPG